MDNTKKAKPTMPEHRGWTGDIHRIYADIESWRDWYWRQYLSDMKLYHEKSNPLFLQFANESRQYSQEYQRLLDIILDVQQAPEVPGLMQYKYGDFPEK